MRGQHSETCILQSFLGFRQQDYCGINNSVSTCADLKGWYDPLSEAATDILIVQNEKTLIPDFRLSSTSECSQENRSSVLQQL